MDTFKTKLDCFGHCESAEADEAISAFLKFSYLKLAIIFFIALICVGFVNTAFSEEEVPIFTTHERLEFWDNYPFVHSYDLENKKIQYEQDALFKNYKDGQMDYSCLPALIRFDTGKDTELMVLSDFITYQKPNFGINDITLGYKWNFSENEKDSVATIFTAEMPNASSNLGNDPGHILPFIMFVWDHKISKKWDCTLNLGEIYDFDNNVKVNYYKTKGFISLTNSINDKTSIYLTLAGFVPNNDFNNPKGAMGISSLSLGLSTTPNKIHTYNFMITKGLSPVDIDWLFMIGVNQRIQL